MAHADSHMNVPQFKDDIQAVNIDETSLSDSDLASSQSSF